MITEIQLSTLIFITASIWAALLATKGTPLSTGLFEPFSNVIGVLVLILAIFDKWIWHWKIFHPWLVSTPYIEGTWKGKIKSTWIDPKTSKTSRSLDAYLVVRQKYSKIHATLITKESKSELLAGEMIKNSDETWQFIGAYRNTSRLPLRTKSPIHHGGMILHVKGHTPIGLEGQYWTDRNTQGEILFTDFSKKKFFDYKSAAAADFLKRN